MVLGGEEMFEEALRVCEGVDSCFYGHLLRGNLAASSQSRRIFRGDWLIGKGASSSILELKLCSLFIKLSKFAPED